MMRTLFIVFLKEIVDNLRDRRTLASALIMGPIFGPVLFAFVINLSIERSLDDVERTMDLPVIGQEHAPNLVRYLESRNIDIVNGPADAAAAAAAVVAAVAAGLFVWPAGTPPPGGSIRWLDAGDRSIMVVEDDADATIIWLLDSPSEGAQRRTERRSV